MGKCPSCGNKVSYLKLLMGNSKFFTCSRCHAEIKINNDRRLIGMLGTISIGLFLAYFVYVNEFSMFSSVLSVILFLLAVFVFPIFYTIEKCK